MDEGRGYKKHYPIPAPAVEKLEKGKKEVTNES